MWLAWITSLLVMVCFIPSLINGLCNYLNKWCLKMRQVQLHLISE